MTTYINETKIAEKMLEMGYELTDESDWVDFLVDAMQKLYDLETKVKNVMAHNSNKEYKD
jgi:hypothetical protein